MRAAPGPLSEKHRPYPHACNAWKRLPSYCRGGCLYVFLYPVALFHVYTRDTAEPTCVLLSRLLIMQDELWISWVITTYGFSLRVKSILHVLSWVTHFIFIVCSQHTHTHKCVYLMGSNPSFIHVLLKPTDKVLWLSFLFNYYSEVCKIVRVFYVSGHFQLFCWPGCFF